MQVEINSTLTSASDIIGVVSLTPRILHRRGKKPSRTTEWEAGWVGRYLPGIKPRFIGDPDSYADCALPVTGEVLFISVCFME